MGLLYTQMKMSSNLTPIPLSVPTNDEKMKILILVFCTQNAI